MSSRTRIVEAGAYNRNSGLAGNRGPLPVVCIAATLIALLAHAQSHRAAAEVTSQRNYSKPVNHALEMPFQGRFDKTTVALAIGDRLKLMFLERIPMASGGTASGVQNSIERTELTGEYDVQGDGSLFLPVIGSVEVSDLDLSAAKEQLEAAYKAVYGKEASASISLASRQPIYVLGPVIKPGTYEYAPGMTVLHALAIAGGTQHGSAGNAEFFDLLRERQRLEQSGERQKRLLARLAILRAERTGQRPPVPDELVALGSRSAAEKLVTEQVAVRKPVLESRKFKIKSLQSTVDTANVELVSQNKRIAHITSSVESKSQRIALLKGLKDLGSMKNAIFLQAQGELSDAQERLDEATGYRAQIADRIAQAVNEKFKAEIDWRVELERDIATAEDSLSDEQAVSAASGQIVRMSRVRSSSPAGDLDQMRFEIHRRGLNGVERMKVDETTELRPGDLVRIRTLGADESLDNVISGQTGVQPRHVN